MFTSRRSKTGNAMTGLRLYAVWCALAVLLFCASAACAETLAVPSAAYPTIQSAIDAAVDGDTIEVAAGTYNESLWWKSKCIALIGAGAHDTIVDATGLGRCLYMADVPESKVIDGAVFTARVEGFTFTGGSSGGGGGVCYDFSAALLAHNIIRDNWGQHFGGGVRLRTSPATLRGNIITNNRCEGSGGGVFVLYADGATLVDNVIMDNSARMVGGGVYVEACSKVTLMGNTVSANSAGLWGGGLYADLSTLTLTNNCFTDNSAGEYGGGLRIGKSTSSTTLTNNTIAMNVGGGLSNLWGSPVITNCILYGNTGEPDLTGVTATYSTVGTGEVDGEGNSSADPMFVDALGRDYHLQDGSPCIDAGNDAAPGLPDTDKDGNDRRVGAAVDMGAYEWQGPSVIEVAIDIKPGSDPNSINLGAEGVVPVAILTTPDFDAALVDEFSLTLSGSAVRLKGKSGHAGSMKDVDGDGDLDLVVQCYINLLELDEGATEAVLRGCIDDGTPIVGYDSIKVVP